MRKDVEEGSGTSAAVGNVEMRADITNCGQDDVNAGGHVGVYDSFDEAAHGSHSLYVQGLFKRVGRLCDGLMNLINSIDYD